MVRGCCRCPEPAGCPSSRAERRRGFGCERRWLWGGHSKPGVGEPGLSISPDSYRLWTLGQNSPSLSLSFLRNFSKSVCPNSTSLASDSVSYCPVPEVRGRAARAAKGPTGKPQSNHLSIVIHSFIHLFIQLRFQAPMACQGLASH